MLYLWFLSRQLSNIMICWPLVMLRNIIPKIRFCVFDFWRFFYYVFCHSSEKWKARSARAEEKSLLCWLAQHLIVFASFRTKKHDFRAKLGSGTPSNDRAWKTVPKTGLESFIARRNDQFRALLHFYRTLKCWTTGPAKEQRRVWLSL